MEASAAMEDAVRHQKRPFVVAETFRKPLDKLICLFFVNGHCIILVFRYVLYGFLLSRFPLNSLLTNQMNSRPESPSNQLREDVASGPIHEFLKCHFCDHFNSSSCVAILKSLFQSMEPGICKGGASVGPSKDLPTGHTTQRWVVSSPRFHQLPKVPEMLPPKITDPLSRLQHSMRLLTKDDREILTAHISRPIVPIWKRIIVWYFFPYLVRGWRSANAALFTFARGRNGVVGAGSSRIGYHCV